MYQAGKQRAGKLPRLAGRTVAAAAKIGVLSGLAILIGCGNTYRPVVAAINPVGPAEQPTQYAAALSTTGPNTPGVLNTVDVFGDTIVDTLFLNSDPRFLALGFTKGAAYSLNGDGTVNYFSVSATAITKDDVSSITLPTGANPNFLLSYGSFNYVSELGRSAVGILQAGSPPTYRQELPVAANPVYLVGINGQPRVYALSNGVTPGQVASIETSTNTISTTIVVGTNPVFGIMSPDGKRVFILNNGSSAAPGSGTISVINSQANQLDSFLDPVTNLPTHTIHDPAAARPVWADLAAAINDLVVVNAGPTPGSRGTLSIISVPICQSSTASSNPNCDPINPVDANGFGTVLANLPVGVNPVMVTVLQDGTQAFVANAGTPAIPASGGNPAVPADPGSVTVINLKTRTVVATVPASADGVCNPLTPTTLNPLTICGHPTWIDSTAGIPTGKVFVVSSDSTNMSVIRADIDAMSTQIPLAGYGVSVRVGSQ